MKTSTRKQKVSTRIFHNTQQVDSESEYKGLEGEQKCGFAKQPCYLTNCPRRKQKGGCDGHVRMTTAERAYELGIPLWRRVNPVRRPRARCSIYDVYAILNIVYEFEFRSNPLVALRIALIFRAALIRNGFAPSDLPIFLSGGGVHLIINIPKIDIEKETAKRWNRAIEKFTHEEINPLFEHAKKIVQAQFQNEDVMSIQLEGHDIARLLSSSGDWRPSTHDEDADYLKQGIIRSVYEDQTLIRNEWKPLKTEIEHYYNDIEQNENEKLETIYQQEGTPVDEELIMNISRDEKQKWRYYLHAHKGESTASALRRKIAYKIKFKKLEGKIKYRIDKDASGKELKRIDRSKLVNQIIFVLCDFCSKYKLDHRLFIKSFQTVINECTGNKYTIGRNLSGAIDFYINCWENKEHRHGEIFETKTSLKEKRSAKMKDDVSIQFFFENYIEFEITSVEIKTDVIDIYKKMCTEFGFKPIGDQQMTRILSEKGIKTKTVGANRTRHYVGLKIKEFSAVYISISSIDGNTAEERKEGNPELCSVCKKNVVHTQHHTTCDEHIMQKNVVHDFEKYKSDLCILQRKYDIIIEEMLN